MIQLCSEALSTVEFIWAPTVAGMAAWIDRELQGSGRVS
jgi:hypothetical protein